MLLAESSKEDRNISLIYLCKIAGGTFKESHEISEMKYFEVDHLPRMLFAEKNLIRMVVESLRSQDFGSLLRVFIAVTRHERLPKS